MLPRLTPLMVCVALASCGANNRDNGQSNGGRTVENETRAPITITITSSAIKDGQAIPAQFSCDGGDQTPAFSWGEPPAGTKSFALVVDDPDAPGGTFRHWGVYDIPASARSIGAGQRVGTEVSNDFGKPGYGGPCPPKGHGPHHYHFKLFALDVDRLNLGSNPKVIEVENEASKHVIAQGELIGTYERR